MSYERITLYFSKDNELEMQLLDRINKKPTEKGSFGNRSWHLKKALLDYYFEKTTEEIKNQTEENNEEEIVSAEKNSIKNIFDTIYSDLGKK